MTDPTFVWVPCPRCQGESWLIADTPYGPTTSMCAYPGCLDGQVVREVAQ